MALKNKHLSTLVLLRLTLCLSVIFLVTVLSIFLILTRISLQHAEKSLRVAAEDVHITYQGCVDRHVQLMCTLVTNGLGSSDTSHTEEELLNYQASYKVTEINIVNREGIVIQSTDQSLLGLDFHDNKQTKDFLVLLDGQKQTFAQGIRQNVTKDKTSEESSPVMRKFVGQAFEDGSGFVELGLDSDTYQGMFAKMSANMTTYWHMNMGGYIIVADKSNHIVSNLHNKHLGESLVNLGLDMDRIEEALQQDRVTTAHLNGRRVLCFASREQQGHLILCVIPYTSAMKNRTTISLFLWGTILIIFVAQGFILIALLKRTVISKIQRVNKSLRRITNGNLDEKIKLTGSVEFQELADDINTTVDSLRNYIADAAARMGKELLYARSIQRSILPSIFPPFPGHHEFDVFAGMRAAREVGGDFYDFFFVSVDRIAFLVADVSGKGFPAALTMMHTKTLLKNYAQGGGELTEVFEHVNRELCEGNTEMVFVTAWMGIMDLTTGKLEMVNAGHTPPMFYQASTGLWSKNKSAANLVLGVMKDYKYHKEECLLHPGDKIFLYTDGITEAMDKSEQLFGEERLLATLESTTRDDAAPTAKKICDAVRNAVESYAEGVLQADDITMLAWCVQELSTPQPGETTRGK